MNYTQFLNAALYKKYLVFASLLLLPLFIFSQEVAQQDSIVVKTPEALQISKIANYGEDTRELIRKTEELIQKESTITEINKDLLKIDSIIELNLVLLRDSLTIFNLSQIDKLENRINIYKSRTDLWQISVARWREQTDENGRLIDFDTKVWELTADSIVSRENNFVNPDSIQTATMNRVKDQVNSNIENLATTKSDLKTWNEILEGLENSLSVTTGEINEVFSLLSIKRENSISNIWIPEYPPIWEMDTDKKAEATNISFKDHYELKKSIIQDFLKQHRDLYYILVFAFVLIFGFIVYLSVRAKKIFEKTPSVLAKGNIVLKYPFLSSIIILAFVIFLFFDVPMELNYIILAILILPFSVLIWERGSNYKVYSVLLFITFSFLLVILPLLSEYIVSLRYSLFFINLVLFILLLFFRSKKQVVQEENTYWLGTLPFLINLFIINTILAAATNIIGSVQLSLMLTQTTIGTIISFITIKEAVLLVQSFLHLELMGPIFKYSNILKDDSKKVMALINKVLKYLAYFFWIYIILDLLKIRKSFISAVSDFINTPLEFGEISISLGNIFAFFIILQVSIWISGLIRYFLDKEVYPRTSISIGSASTFSLLIKYSFMLFGFLFALIGAGVELSKVAVGFGALGIGVGFGLKNIVNNFVCGIILAIERPIKIGDIIEVDGVSGQVKDIGLRASLIGCWDGSDVVVPNDSLISGKLMNMTFDDRRHRLEIELHLGVDIDVEEVLNLLIDTAKTVPGVMEDPGPYANYTGIVDGKSILKVYGWVNDYSNQRLIGIDFKIAVYKALKDAGIEMAVPIINIKR